MKTIGLVILGAAGYMAEDNAFSCLSTAKTALLERGIHLHVVIAADPDLYNTTVLDVALKNRRKMRNHFFHLNPFYLEYNADLAIYEIQEDFSAPVRNFPEAILFYDASPTNKHYYNLARILSCENENFYYLGEKPIFTDPATINGFTEEIDDLPIFCDFIETCNPAVTAMTSYIKDNDLRIEKMAFWRAGSSGIKHIIGHEQQGVQGGAFLDKAPHDFSISTMLLDPRRISDFIIKDCDVLALVPDVPGLTPEASKKRKATFSYSAQHFGSSITLTF